MAVKRATRPFSRRVSPHGQIDVVPILMLLHVREAGQQWRFWFSRLVKAMIPADVVRPGAGFNKSCIGLVNIPVCLSGAFNPQGMVGVMAQYFSSNPRVGSSSCCQAITADSRCPAAFHAGATGLNAIRQKPAALKTKWRIVNSNLIKAGMSSDQG